jgi:hypothetical protein
MHCPVVGIGQWGCESKVGNIVVKEDATWPRICLESHVR